MPLRTAWTAARMRFSRWSFASMLVMCLATVFELVPDLVVAVAAGELCEDLQLAFGERDGSRRR
jgi:hypothetical protein